MVSDDTIVTLERRCRILSRCKTWQMRLPDAIDKLYKMGYMACKSFESGDRSIRCVWYGKFGCKTEYLMVIPLS